MRQFFAVILLLLFGFYHSGFYMLHKLAMHQVDEDWRAKIVNDEFSNASLEYASIPISLPYMPAQESYQAVDHKVELNGKHYRVVKQRYTQDTLHIIYVADRKMDHYQDSFQKLIKKIANPEESGHQEVPLGLKITFSGFLMAHFQFEWNSLVSDQNGLMASGSIFNYSSKYGEVPTPPPQI